MADQGYEQIMDAIAQELQTFQWSCGADRSQNRGEIWVDRYEKKLTMEVWVNDNEDPGDDKLKPLIVSQSVMEYRDPREQIRDLIHRYLCHEADEQIWFGEERPYYPH